MGIFDFLNKKNNQPNTQENTTQTNITDSSLKNEEDTYDFEKFKEILSANTLLFDIGSSFRDSDKHTSFFQKQDYPELQKTVQVNTRKKTGDPSGDIQQIVIHLQDYNKQKESNSSVFIIFSKEEILIGSSTWKLTDLAKEKGYKNLASVSKAPLGLYEGQEHIFEQDIKIKYNEIPSYLEKLDNEFVNLFNSLTSKKTMEYGFKFNSNETRNTNYESNETKRSR